MPCLVRCDGLRVGVAPHRGIACVHLLGDVFLGAIPRGCRADVGRERLGLFGGRRVQLSREDVLTTVVLAQRKVAAPVARIRAHEAAMRLLKQLVGCQGAGVMRDRLVELPGCQAHRRKPHPKACRL